MKNFKTYLVGPGGIKYLLLGFLRFYQRTFSPDHGTIVVGGNLSRCRFYPSCSEYTRRAISQYGLLKGSVVSLGRVVKCAPWHPGGYDPVE